MIRRLVAAGALAVSVGVLAPAAVPLFGFEVASAEPTVLRGIKDGRIGTWYIYEDVSFFVPD